MLEDSPGTGATLGEGFHNETNDRYVELLRDHPYLPRFPLSDVRASPYVLPKGFRWSDCNLTDEYTCDEICSLLTFRTIQPYDMYNDSKEYLGWSLCPPGYFPDWHVGVRESPSRILVAFISAVPTRIRVRDMVFPMADFCRLYVDVTVREKIPRSVLISEILRRVNSRGIWQQVHRWESFLPAPIVVSRLWERHLDLRKMKDLDYNTPQPGLAIKRTTRSCPLPDFIGRPGIREMRPSDVPAVTVLLGNYLSQFAIAPAFTEEDVNHWLLPRGNVSNSFVIEETAGDHPEITDFFSYTRMQSRREREFPLVAARLFYYATRSTTPSLPRLIRDALLTAKYHRCEVFTVNDFMNNGTFLRELMFEQIDGRVQYNLNNYPMDVLQCSEVGLSLPP